MHEKRDVLNAVCDYLIRVEGFSIPNRFRLNPEGDKKQDVSRSTIAIHPEKGRLLINAYGENLSKGARPFTEDEVYAVVGKATHGGICRRFSRDREEGDTVVLCFPATNSFWKYLRPAKDGLDALGIIVYRVRDDNSVERL